MLSLIIFLPTIAALGLFFIPSSQARNYAFVTSLISFALTLTLWLQFDAQSAAMQFTEVIPWIPTLGIHYALGVDGIALPLVALSAFIAPIAWLGTWPTESVAKEKFFVACALVLQTGMYGTFLSTDLFLFYFFWEIVLIPMFFLIGIWGGQNRIYATVKFFIYTMIGSLLMLVAIFWLAAAAKEQLGTTTTLMTDLAKLQLSFNAENPWLSPQALLFMAFTLAFVIKVPMVPFHTWLPDAHVQAPTLGSVFLAAVLLKMGTYGIIRISLPLFPAASLWAAPVLQILGCVGILYGAFCAMAQNDFKKLVAYSSVSHMGYIVVGLFSFNTLAIAGSLYQMVNHGIAAAGLFIVVGMLYERLHTRDLNKFGQIAKSAPMMAVAFMIMTLSSVALPGTNGFVGEFTILLGTFQQSMVLAGICGLGVIFGAVYSLKAYQKVMLGPSSVETHGALHADHHADHHSDHHDGHGEETFAVVTHDMTTKEIIAMSLLSIFIFVVGFFPETFFGASKVSLEALATALGAK